MHLTIYTTFRLVNITFCKVILDFYLKIDKT